MFKWTKGRQNTGYEKLKLFQFLTFDCYILRYKVGDSIPKHKDPVPGYRHFRLNFELKKAEVGGEVKFYKMPAPKKGIYKYHPLSLATLIKTDRMVFFRSDIITHKVTEIEKGERIVLTFGICLPI